MKPPALMIYGATGYTGRMIAEHAVAAGLDPILAGRNAAELATLAGDLSVHHRAFSLADAAAIDEAIEDVSVLLNCAGPFGKTADASMAACIRSRVHYLDIAAEVAGYLLAEELDGQAAAAGVMLLPGSGGSVAMLGCLVGQTSERVSAPRRVRVALDVAGSMSRGSVVSATANVTASCLERVDGVLTDRSQDDVHDFDFGSGPETCSAVTLPDLVSIWQATRIPDIETFVHISGAAFPTDDPDELPDGPTLAHRQANRYRAAAEVTGEDGHVAHSILDTVNGYTFTVLAATEAARRVLAGEYSPGFQSPAALFGVDFAETIADTRITDLASR